MTAYTAKYEGGKIVLTEVTEIPAGVGVILMTYTILQTWALFREAPLTSKRSARGTFLFYTINFVFQTLKCVFQTLKRMSQSLQHTFQSLKQNIFALQNTFSFRC